MTTAIIQHKNWPLGNLSIWFALLLTWVVSARAAEVPHQEVLPDAVEHWYHTTNSAKSPYLFELLRSICSLTSEEDLSPPFGRSAALLVGVSQYQYLNHLPSATNDLILMRDLLLSKGGFDDVYIMKNETVNRDHVELYMKSVLPNMVGVHGRILFYYTGHGGDANGKIGYMVYSHFKPENYFGQSVLPLTLLEDWSSELMVKHMLFVLDSCASGMLFVPKANQNEEAALFNTLSGRGSRTFITAGVDKRPAYCTSDELTNNSAFTKAFVESFNSPHDTVQRSAFATITEIFGKTERALGVLSIKYHRKLTPRIIPLADEEHDGTFVFVNPEASNAVLTAQEAEYLKVPLKSKGSETEQFSARGVIQITSDMDGSVFIDNKRVSEIARGEVQTYFSQEPGAHRVEVRGAKKLVQEAEVKSGELCQLQFGSEVNPATKCPLINDNTSLAGAINIECLIPGDLLIDDYKVGSSTSNTVYPLKLTLGRHTYRLVGKGVVSQKSFTVEDATQGLKPLPGLEFDASVGKITAPFVISNGIIYQAVSTEFLDGGRASYSFTITEPGDYAVAGTVCAPSTNESSFYVNLDGEPQGEFMRWDVYPVAPNFDQRLVSWRGKGSSSEPQFLPKYFTLSTGLHRLIIKGKTPNVALRSFTISRRPSPPTGLRIVAAD